MEVCLHILEHQIDVAVILGTIHVIQLNDVIVLELPQEHNLAVRTLSISGVLEGIEYLLEREYLFGFFIDYFPYVAIGSTADLLDDIISFQDVLFDILAHWLLYNTMRISSNSLHSNSVQYLNAQSIKTKHRCKPFKNISNKLQPLIKWSLALKSNHNLEISAMENSKTQLLKMLLERYAKFSGLPKDGNSFYRILALQHYRSICKDQIRMKQFYQTLERQDFEIYLLSNRPQDFDEYFKKSKLVGIHKMLPTCLNKYTNKGNSIPQAFVNLINIYDYIDFALISLYRLIVYYSGYKKLYAQMEDMLDGNEQNTILSYGCEVTPLIIKMASAALGIDIYLFNISESDIDMVSYRSQDTVNQDVFDIMCLGRRYCLLEEKNTNLKPKQQCTPIEENKQCDEFTPKNNFLPFHLISTKRQSEDNRLHRHSILQSEISYVASTETVEARKQIQFVSLTVETKIKPTRKQLCEVKRNIQVKIQPTKKQGSLNLMMTPKNSKPASNNSSQRRVGSISRQHKPHFDDISRFMELKSQQINFYEQQYKSINETDRKKIVLIHLKQTFESQYVKRICEQNLKTSTAKLTSATVSNHSSRVQRYK